MRIVLADDSAILREGLVRLLEEMGHEVTAAVGSATELEHQVRSGASAGLPELVITDIRMPPRHADDGLRSALILRAEFPGLPCLLLSQHTERAYAEELLADGAGGVGYLLKDRVTDLAAFSRAIEMVAAGGTVIDPDLAAQLVARRTDPLGSLSAREREVLTLMAEGRSNAGICEALVLSTGAVEKHVTSIFLKLGLQAAADDHRRVLAVLAFLRSN